MGYYYLVSDIHQFSNRLHVCDGLNMNPHPWNPDILSNSLDQQFILVEDFELFHLIKESYDSNYPPVASKEHWVWKAKITDCALTHVIEKKVITHSVVLTEKMTMREFVQTFSPQQQEDLIQLLPHYIQFITEPTETMQLKAAQTNGHLLRYIEKPTQAVRDAAVENNPYAIQYMSLSLADQLDIVQRDPTKFRYIQSPDPKTISLAIELHPTNVMFVENLTLAEQMLVAEKNESLIVYVKNLFPEVFLAVVNKSNISSPTIKQLIQMYCVTEERQLLAIEHTPDFVQFMIDPCLNVQKRVIRINPLHIQFLSNPSEEIQLMAVQTNGNAIKYIDQPSEAMQLEAIKQDIQSIVYIQKPSLNIQMRAIPFIGPNISLIHHLDDVVMNQYIRLHPFYIKYLPKASIYTQELAVSIEPYAIKYIKNPHASVKLTAVQQNGLSIQFIQNPSETIQLAAVQQNPFALKYLPRAPIYIVVQAVLINPSVVQFVHKPSLEVQRLAVQQDIMCIDLILNLDLQIKEYAENERQRKRQKIDHICEE